MVDRKRSRRTLISGKRAERRRTPATCGNVDVLQSIWRLCKARVDFHDDVVLIQSCIHRRHLPLAERIVKRAVNGLLRDSKPSRRRAIELKRKFKSTIQLIGVDIRHARQAPQSLKQFRRPLDERIDVIGLQRVLILRIADTTTNSNILDSLQVQRCSRDSRKLPTQSRYDLIS